MPRKTGYRHGDGHIEEWTTWIHRYSPRGEFNNRWMITNDFEIQYSKFNQPKNSAKVKKI